MKPAKRFYPILYFAVALLLAAAVCAYAQHSRDEAYSQLKDSIVEIGLGSFESHGSEIPLPPETIVICGQRSVSSPQDTCWLFSIDYYYRARWAHPLELYFVDVNDLTIHITEEMSWWVENIPMDFLEVFFPEEVKDDGLLMPSDFTVFPAYPNPFNSSTNIEFTISYPAKVAISIFDINGRLINNLPETECNIGAHIFRWDMYSGVGVVPGGWYIVKFRSRELQKCVTVNYLR